MAAEPDAAAPARSSDGARRVVTVLFCDLVGSTELAGRLDPEELRDVIRGFHATCERAVEEAGGRVANYMGDGLLALFGAPVAQEDAPVRAVRAGLAMVEGVAGLPPTDDGSRIEVRVGVHTGLVVIGEMGAGAAKVEVDVIGETPNIAARLQGAASAGTVLASDATERLVRGFVQLEPVGRLQLKGVQRVVDGYRAVALTGARDRLEVRPHLPLVGRDAEVAAVVAAIEAARAGRSRVVVVTGDAGIGKTRLLAEARLRAGVEAEATIVWRGTPDHRGTPLHPVLHHLRSRLDDVPADVAATVDVPTVSQIDVAERLREDTIETLRSWIVGRALAGLVVLVVDDLHWLDPSTVELLDGLVEAELPVALAVLVAGRPDVEARWLGGAHLVRVELTPLDEDATRELVAELGLDADDAVVARIAERAEGVPLFVEEFARMAAADGATSADAVPDTLDSLLHARLARVGEDIELVRLCAVLGRDVDVPVLAAVAGFDEEEAAVRLKDLVTAGVAVLSPDGSRMTFRHVLLRDAAYESMLRADRKTMHRVTAETLVDRFPTLVAQQPEQLARQWTGAGEVEEAIEAWARAGRAAADRYALHEATAHFRQALDLLPRMAPSTVRDRRELLLLLELSPIGFRLWGGGDERLDALDSRLGELVRDIDVPTQRFAVLQLLYAQWSAKPDHPRTAALLEQELALAEEVGSATMLLHAHSSVGADRYLVGDFLAAREHLERCLALYDPTRRSSPNGDPGLLAAIFLAAVLLELEGSEAARVQVEQAVDLARRRDQPFMLTLTLMQGAKVHALRRDPTAASALAAEASALAVSGGYSQIEPQVRCLLGWSAALLDDDPWPGVRTIEDGLEAIRRSRSLASSSLHRLLLVQAYRVAGDADAARRVAIEALSFCEATGERAHQARLLQELAQITG